MMSFISTRIALVAGLSLCAAAPTDTNPFTLNARSGIPGQASHYSPPQGGGACGFKTFQMPSGIYRAAISSENWYNAGNCGACLAVTGPTGNQITAMVVDSCGGCAQNFLNIDEPGYRSLTGTPFRDKISTEWQIVSCALNSPLAIQLASGVSKYWFSAQIQGSNYPVKSLEVGVRDQNGDIKWESTVSRDYNFFESNGAGFGEVVDIKVNCFNGGVVITRDVDVTKERKIWTQGNC